MTEAPDSTRPAAETEQTAPSAADFVIEDGVLTDWKGEGETVTVPRGVTEIGRRAFFGRRGLREVVIPDGVRTIGENAFADCRGLRSVRLPGSLETVRKGAFDGCGSLTELRFPEGVREIGTSVFYNDRGLRLVTLPGSLEKIGWWSFKNCPCEIRIPHWIPSLEEALSEEMGINRSARILTEDPIGVIPEAFRIPALLAFAAEDRNEPGSARTRSYERFARRHARDLISKAFARPELLHLLCSRDLIPPGTVGDYLAEAEKNGSIEQKAMLLASIGRIGPERVARAREARQTVEEANTGKREARLARLGTGADIAGLHFVIRGRMVPRPVGMALSALLEWLERHGAVADETLTRRTDYLLTLSDYYGADGLIAGRTGTVRLSLSEFCLLVGLSFDEPKTADFEVPAWLTEIRDGAFSGFGIRSLRIPGAVRKIGADVCRDCTRLVRVELPEGLLSIGAGAFFNCGKLKEITLPESLTELGAEAFHKCGSLTALKIPAGVTSIGDQTFKFCGTLKELELPPRLTSIGFEAFRNCTGLTALKIPDGVTEIPDKAFRSCIYLREISLPEGLRRIGDRAFKACYHLGEVRVPDSLEKIEYGAFSECSELTLRGRPGSYAERWARENRVRFEPI